MPYIKQNKRADISYEGIIDPKNIETAGDLNFAITTLVHFFLSKEGNPNYQKFNDAIGALEGAKLELYRKKTAPYEDVKETENGSLEDFK